MTAPRRTLIVFAKWPKPGRVKTRLAATLGEQRAAEFAHAFLLDTVATVERLDVRRTLAYSPHGSRELFLRLLSGRWQLRMQRGRDLGERLAAGLAGLAEPTVIIGTDSPWLSGGVLEGAFAALAQADVVLGPCRDGGYYLIGVRDPVAAAGLFTGIRWSTGNTLGDQVAAARRRGLSCALLAEGYDVDTADDLARLAADAAALPASALANTREVLSRQG